MKKEDRLPAAVIDQLCRDFNKGTISEADTEKLFTWLKLYAESRLQRRNIKLRLAIEYREEITNDALVDTLSILRRKDTDNFRSPMAYLCRAIDTRIRKSADKIVKTYKREAELVALANEHKHKHGINAKHIEQTYEDDTIDYYTKGMIKRLY